MEIWKPIEGYNGDYQVSNFGRIKSYKRNREKILKERLDKKGYNVVLLYNYPFKPKGSRVHRLVAQAFIPNEENKLFVNHLDANVKNNNLDNLEWCTASENVKHSFNLGNKTQKGERNNCSKLLEKQVRVIKHILQIPTRISDKHIGQIFGVKRKAINDIKTGRNWKHVHT